MDKPFSMNDVRVGTEINSQRYANKAHLGTGNERQLFLRYLSNF